MIKLHLSFALHEVLSFLIFANPLASDVASRHAETHQVSCIIDCVWELMTQFYLITVKSISKQLLNNVFRRFPSLVLLY